MLGCRRAQHRAARFSRRVTRHDDRQCTITDANNETAIVRVGKRPVVRWVKHAPRGRSKREHITRRDRLDCRASPFACAQSLASRSTPFARPRNELGRDENARHRKGPNNFRNRSIVIQVGMRDKHSIERGDAECAQRGDNRLRSNSRGTETSTVQENS